MAQNTILMKAESVSELREKLQAVDVIGLEVKEIDGFKLHGTWHAKYRGDFEPVFIGGSRYNASDVSVGYKWLTLPVDGSPTRVKPDNNARRGDSGWITVKLKSQPNIWD